MVGDANADPLAERKVIVELKVGNVYRSKDDARLFNELEATGAEIGLLTDFDAKK